jgi:hypothetical protein
MSIIEWYLKVNIPGVGKASSVRGEKNSLDRMSRTIADIENDIKENKASNPE